MALTGKLSADERLTRETIFKAIMVGALGIFAGLALGYAMAGGNLGDVSLDFMFSGDFLWNKFGTGFLIGIVAALTVGCFIYIDYEKKKNTRIGSEHGTAKIMSAADMTEWNRHFFYNPKIVGATEGWAKDAQKKKKKTKYDMDELKLICKEKKFSTKVKDACFLKSQIMGQDVYLSYDTKFINRNLNTLTVGGSGQGKSYSELFPNALNAPSAGVNLVFTDPSGEIYQKMGKFLQNQGYELKVFNVDEFNLSQKYNPLMYIKTDKDYNILVDALVENISDDKPTGTGNEFFVKAAKSLTCSLIALLRELYPILPIPDDATEEEKKRIEEQNEINAGKQVLSNFMELLRMARQESTQNGGTTSTLDAVFKKLKAVNKYSYAAKMWENFSTAGIKVANEIIVSAAADYGRYFDNPEIAYLTSKDELKLDELASEKPCALFLIIPQSTKSYNWLCAVAYSQLFDIMTKAGKANRDLHNLENPELPRHLSLWLDEFANIGKIPNFIEMLSVVRKYNISINIIIQGMGQLKSLYEREQHEIILANLDTLIYLGGMEPGTVKWLSEKLGKETIKQISTNMGNMRQPGTQTYSNMGRPLMTPDEIEQMTRAHELIFISGCKPIRTRKYNLSKHPYYRLCGEGDPAQNLNIREELGDRQVDYKKLEENIVTVSEINRYDFSKLILPKGVERGEIRIETAKTEDKKEPVSVLADGYTEDAAMKEAEKRARYKQLCDSKYNQKAEEILERYDLTNAQAIEGFVPDYEFTEADFNLSGTNLDPLEPENTASDEDDKKTVREGIQFPFLSIRREESVGTHPPEDTKDTDSADEADLTQDPLDAGNAIDDASMQIL